MARRFLYVIAALIVLVIVFALSWGLFQDRWLRMAFVPHGAFAPLAADTAPDYVKAATWVARPDLPDDPARWLPPGVVAGGGHKAAVFYIAPTTYLGTDRWNGPIDDAASRGRLDLFTRSQASAFNGIADIWAPRYRQATFGAFLVATDPRAKAAMDFAYRDVARAFDAFVAAQPADRPLILAGHSQGSFHLLRLVQEKVRGTPLARRIVAVYAIGWPISLTADLPALGLPGCKTAGQAGCIVDWQSFADPADPRLLDTYFDATNGYTGLPRKGSAMLCVNPLTGTAGGGADASANKGSLVPDATMTSATLAPALVPAGCSPKGLLLIGDASKGYGSFVLPGNNYHVFDYALFWANLRADAAARLMTFLKQ
ncbi:DUF3089 domain-containing protein [Sphingomonas sp. MMS24-J13]|uniref:DUF3089 domain-containing protein n=1 Tax=Sphingomonas sp. MMS24-J13 TaxID=3238686 RepID=UPI00384FCBF3